MALIDRVLGRYKKEVSALVEGTYSDEWGTLQYKFVDLPLEATSAVNDGENKYKLYGITPDFERIIPLNTDIGDLEVNVGDLRYLGNYRPIDRVRSLILRDGRIFIDEQMLEQGYAERLPQLLKHAKDKFTVNEKS
ncbi:MAG: hypothetical protein AABW41_05340 [Nanoarchaeota archaeon]